VEEYPLSSDHTGWLSNSAFKDRYVPIETMLDLLYVEAARKHGWQPRQEKKMQLTPEELIRAVPPELQDLLEDCEFQGCGVDTFGIPLCLTTRTRAMIVPHAVEALKEMNKMGTGPNGEEWDHNNPVMFSENLETVEEVDEEDYYGGEI
jgi:hypothetical protein